MFFDFGHADYSIPLGIAMVHRAGQLIVRASMRIPMLICGLTTLVFPLYVVPRLGTRNRGNFRTAHCNLPLPVLYTRIARPYAITLLLG